MARTDRRGARAPHPAKGASGSASHAAKAAPTRDHARASTPLAEAAPPIERDRADRALTALAWTLALLAASRVAFTFAPGTWGWSLAAARDLGPVWGWTPWIIAALTLVPAVGSRLAPLAQSLGDRVERSAIATFTITALLAACLVLAMPDRVRFVGDALLRQRTLEVQGLIPTAWYPQALPLDLTLHHGFAGWLMRTLGTGADLPGRVIGALDAVLLAACACALPRVLGLRGAAALAAGSVLFWGGALTLFTGYNKAFAEMCVFTAASGVLALHAARTGRGLWLLGLVFAAAILSHRSALALLPVVAVTWLLAPRASSLGALLGAAIAPLAALAAMLPRIVHIVTHIDPMHFTPQQLAGEGPLRALMGGARPVDLANLLVFLAPLALAIPVLAVALGRPPGARREAWVMAALALPFLAILPFIHPGQGLFRDWDDFGATGVAVALVAAWLVGRTLEASPRGASLAFAVVLSCAAPTVQWLAHHEDLDRGLTRVRRFVTEAPQRAAFERAVTWQFLGQAESDRGRFVPAADACAEAYALLPSPNVSRQWGMAELRAARLDRAAHVFRGMVARDSNDVVAWTGLALAIADGEDAAESRRVSEHAARLDPDRRVLDAMMRALGPAIPMRSR